MAALCFNGWRCRVDAHDKTALRNSLILCRRHGTDQVGRLVPSDRAKEAGSRWAGRARRLETLDLQILWENLDTPTDVHECTFIGLDVASVGRSQGELSSFRTAAQGWSLLTIEHFVSSNVTPFGI